MELNKVGAIYNLNAKRMYIYHKNNSLYIKDQYQCTDGQRKVSELQDPGKGGVELEDRDVFIEGGQVIISFDPVNPFALKLSKLPPLMMGVALKMQPNGM